MNCFGRILAVAVGVPLAALSGGVALADSPPSDALPPLTLTINALPDSGPTTLKLTVSPVSDGMSARLRVDADTSLARPALVTAKVDTNRGTPVMVIGPVDKQRAFDRLVPVGPPPAPQAVGCGPHPPAGTPGCERHPPAPASAQAPALPPDQVSQQGPPPAPAPEAAPQPTIDLSADRTPLRLPATGGPDLGRLASPLLALVGLTLVSGGFSLRRLNREPLLVSSSARGADQPPGPLAVASRDLEPGANRPEGGVGKALVLVVDDEPKIRRFVSANLRAHGYRVSLAQDGEEALERAALEPPDLVLLDLKLPRLDGLGALEQLREWCHVPVLVLSAWGDEQRKVQALDLGADDYLTKPFGMGELLARVRAALRRAAASAGLVGNTPVLEVGPLRIDQARRQVWLREREIRLTRTEFELLRCLASDAGKVLTHGELLRRVWHYEHAEEIDSLRTFVKQVRRKLEPDPARPRYLLTEPGVGYRLVTSEAGGPVQSTSNARPGARSAYHSAYQVARPPPERRVLAERRDKLLTVGDDLAGRCPQAWTVPGGCSELGSLARLAGDVR